jgi:hypothetical protein
LSCWEGAAEKEPTAVQSRLLGTNSGRRHMVACKDVHSVKAEVIPTDR